MRKQHLKLTDTDHRYLTELLSKGQTHARVIRRAAALLQLHHGATLQLVADTLKLQQWTVSLWRNKYVQEGLEFLQDKPRTGRPIEIDGQQRAKITALACSAAPEGRAKWSLRLLADKIVELGFCESVSHTQVAKILKKQTPTALKEDVVYRRDKRGVFVSDGTNPGGLCSSLQSPKTGYLL